MEHFLTIADLTGQEVRDLIDRAAQMKKAQLSGRRELPLQGRSLALLFEKPSLRTRVSFEAAMAQLGGTNIFIQSREIGLGTRESVTDFARVISQYVDVLVARVFDHQLVVELAEHATIPIVNGLSDLAHPCQVLGDLLTIHELCGQIEGRKIAFVGDGNNVARSLATGSVMLGAKFLLAAPSGYEFQEDFLRRTQQLSGTGSIETTNDPNAAVDGADVVYTDVWASMGQESEREGRRSVFAGYQVNAELLRHAPATVKVMHCLPAHRGEEITDEVIDGPNSVVIQQAANRLHAQMGLLVGLLAESEFPIRRTAGQ